jgi:CAP-Gly domain/WW domain/F-box-like/DHR-2, Lobe C
MDGKLPPGWLSAVSANGRVYYFNATTETTQWEKPVVPGPEAGSASPRGSEGRPSTAPTGGRRKEEEEKLPSATISPSSVLQRKMKKAGGTVRMSGDHSLRRKAAQADLLKPQTRARSSSLVVPGFRGGRGMSEVTQSPSQQRKLGRDKSAASPTGLWGRMKKKGGLSAPFRSSSRNRSTVPILSEERPKGTGFKKLPVPVLMQIFSHLDGPSLAQVSATCRFWNSVLPYRDELWIPLIEQTFSREHSAIPKLRGSAESWVHVWAQLHHLGGRTQKEVGRKVELLPSSADYQHDMADHLVRLAKYAFASGDIKEFLQRTTQLQRMHESVGNHVEAACSFLMSTAAYPDDDQQAAVVATSGSTRQLSRSCMHRRTEVVELAAAALSSGKRYEHANKLLVQRRKLHDKRDEPAIVRQLEAAMQQSQQDLSTAERLPAEYFFVSFHGLSFPGDLHGRSFVYRGDDCERLGDFVGRLKVQFSSAEIVNTTDAFSPKIKKVQQIAVTHCTPANMKVLPGNVAKKHYSLKRRRPKRLGMTLGKHVVFDPPVWLFVRQMAFRKIEEGGTKHDPGAEFRDAWVTETYVFVRDPLPGVQRRAEIQAEVSLSRAPIENAVSMVASKNQEILRMTADTKGGAPWKSNFSMALNGTVDAAIGGGIKQLGDIFLSPKWMTAHPEFEAQCMQLEQESTKLIIVLADAIEVHGRVVPKEMRALHEHLVDFYKKLLQDSRVQDGFTKLQDRYEKDGKSLIRAQSAVRRWLARRRFNSLLDLRNQRLRTLTSLVNDQAKFARDCESLLSVFVKPLISLQIAEDPRKLAAIFANCHGLSEISQVLSREFSRSIVEFHDPGVSGSRAAQVGLLSRAVSSVLCTEEKLVRHHFVAYLVNVHDAVGRLQELQAKNEKFLLFCKEQQRLEAAKGASSNTDIMALLIAPMQHWSRLCGGVRRVVELAEQENPLSEETAALREMDALCKSITADINAETQRRKRATDAFEQEIAPTPSLNSAWPPAALMYHLGGDQQLHADKRKPDSGDDESARRCYVFGDSIILTTDRRGSSRQKVLSQMSLEETRVLLKNDSVILEPKGHRKRDTSPSVTLTMVGGSGQREQTFAQLVQAVSTAKDRATGMGLVENSISAAFLSSPRQSVAASKDEQHPPGPQKLVRGLTMLDLNVFSIAAQRRPSVSSTGTSVTSVDESLEEDETAKQKGEGTETDGESVKEGKTRPRLTRSRPQLSFSLSLDDVHADASSRRSRSQRDLLSSDGDDGEPIGRKIPQLVATAFRMLPDSGASFVMPEREDSPLGSTLGVGSPGMLSMGSLPLPSSDVMESFSLARRTEQSDKRLNRSTSALALNDSSPAISVEDLSRRTMGNNDIKAPISEGEVDSVSSSTSSSQGSSQVSNLSVLNDDLDLDALSEPSFDLNDDLDLDALTEPSFDVSLPGDIQFSESDLSDGTTNPIESFSDGNDKHATGSSSEDSAVGAKLPLSNRTMSPVGALSGSLSDSEVVRVSLPPPLEPSSDDNSPRVDLLPALPQLVVETPTPLPTPAVSRKGGEQNAEQVDSSASPSEESSDTNSSGGPASDISGEVCNTPRCLPQPDFLPPALVRDSTSTELSDDTGEALFTEEDGTGEGFFTEEGSSYASFQGGENVESLNSPVSPQMEWGGSPVWTEEEQMESSSGFETSSYDQRASGSVRASGESSPGFERPGFLSTPSATPVPSPRVDPDTSEDSRTTSSVFIPHTPPDSPSVLLASSASSVLRGIPTSLTEDETASSDAAARVFDESQTRRESFWKAPDFEAPVLSQKVTSPVLNRKESFWTPPKMPAPILQHSDSKDSFWAPPDAVAPVLAGQGSDTTINDSTEFGSLTDASGSQNSLSLEHSESSNSLFESETSGDEGASVNALRHSRSSSVARPPSVLSVAGSVSSMTSDDVRDSASPFGSRPRRRHTATLSTSRSPKSGQDVYSQPRSSRTAADISTSLELGGLANRANLPRSGSLSDFSLSTSSLTSLGQPKDAPSSVKEPLFDEEESGRISALSADHVVTGPFEQIDAGLGNEREDISSDQPTNPPSDTVSEAARTGSPSASSEVNLSPLDDFSPLEGDQLSLAAPVKNSDGEYLSDEDSQASQSIHAIASVSEGKPFNVESSDVEIRTRASSDVSLELSDESVNSAETRESRSESNDLTLDGALVNTQDPAPDAENFSRSESMVAVDVPASVSRQEHTPQEEEREIARWIALAKARKPAPVAPEMLPPTPSREQRSRYLEQKENHEGWEEACVLLSAEMRAEHALQGEPWLIDGGVYHGSRKLVSSDSSVYLSDSSASVSLSPDDGDEKVLAMALEHFASPRSLFVSDLDSDSPWEHRQTVPGLSEIEVSSLDSTSDSGLRSARTRDGFGTHRSQRRGSDVSSGSVPFIRVSSEGLLKQPDLKGDSLVPQGLRLGDVGDSASSESKWSANLDVHLPHDPQRGNLFDQVVDSETASRGSRSSENLSPEGDDGSGLNSVGEFDDFSDHLNEILGSFSSLDSEPLLLDGNDQPVQLGEVDDVPGTTWTADTFHLMQEPPRGVPLQLGEIIDDVAGHTWAADATLFVRQGQLTESSKVTPIEADRSVTSADDESISSLSLEVDVVLSDSEHSLSFNDEFVLSDSSDDAVLELSNDHESRSSEGIRVVADDALILKEEADLEGETMSAQGDYENDFDVESVGSLSLSVDLVLSGSDKDLNEVSSDKSQSHDVHVSKEDSDQETAALLEKNGYEDDFDSESLGSLVLSEGDFVLSGSENDHVVSSDKSHSDDDLASSTKKDESLEDVQDDFDVESIGSLSVSEYDVVRSDTEKGPMSDGTSQSGEAVVAEDDSVTSAKAELNSYEDDFESASLQSLSIEDDVDLSESEKGVVDVLSDNESGEKGDSASAKELGSIVDETYLDDFDSESLGSQSLSEDDLVLSLGEDDIAVSTSEKEFAEVRDDKSSVADAIVSRDGTVSPADPVSGSVGLPSNDEDFDSESLRSLSISETDVIFDSGKDIVDDLSDTKSRTSLQDVLDSNPYKTEGGSIEDLQDDFDVESIGSISLSNDDLVLSGSEQVNIEISRNDFDHSWHDTIDSEHSGSESNALSLSGDINTSKDGSMGHTDENGSTGNDQSDFDLGSMGSLSLSEDDLVLSGSETNPIDVLSDTTSHSNDKSASSIEKATETNYEDDFDDESVRSLSTDDIGSEKDSVEASSDKKSQSGDSLVAHDEVAKDGTIEQLEKNSDEGDFDTNFLGSIGLSEDDLVLSDSVQDPVEASSGNESQPGDSLVAHDEVASSAKDGTIEQLKKNSDEDDFDTNSLGSIALSDDDLVLSGSVQDSVEASSGNESQLGDAVFAKHESVEDDHVLSGSENDLQIVVPNDIKSQQSDDRVKDESATSFGAIEQDVFSSESLGSLSLSEDDIMLSGSEGFAGVLSDSDNKSHSDDALLSDESTESLPNTNYEDDFDSERSDDDIVLSDSEKDLTIVTEDSTSATDETGRTEDDYQDDFDTESVGVLSFSEGDLVLSGSEEDSVEVLSNKSNAFHSKVDSASSEEDGSIGSDEVDDESESLESSSVTDDDLILSGSEKDQNPVEADEETFQSGDVEQESSPLPKQDGNGLEKVFVGINDLRPDSDNDFVQSVVAQTSDPAELAAEGSTGASTPASISLEEELVFSSSGSDAEQLVGIVAEGHEGSDNLDDAGSIDAASSDSNNSTDHMVGSESDPVSEPEAAKSPPLELARASKAHHEESLSSVPLVSADHASRDSDLSSSVPAKESAVEYSDDSLTSGSEIAYSDDFESDSAPSRSHSQDADSDEAVVDSSDAITAERKRSDPVDHQDPLGRDDVEALVPVVATRSDATLDASPHESESSSIWTALDDVLEVALISWAHDQKKKIATPLDVSVIRKRASFHGRRLPSSTPSPSPRRRPQMFSATLSAAPIRGHVELIDSVREMDHATTVHVADDDVGERLLEYGPESVLPLFKLGATEPTWSDTGYVWQKIFEDAGLDPEDMAQAVETFEAEKILLESFSDLTVKLLNGVLGLRVGPSLQIVAHRDAILSRLKSSRTTPERSVPQVGQNSPENLSVREQTGIFTPEDQSSIFTPDDRPDTHTPEHPPSVRVIRAGAAVDKSLFFGESVPSSPPVRVIEASKRQEPARPKSAGPAIVSEHTAPVPRPRSAANGGVRVVPAGFVPESSLFPSDTRFENNTRTRPGAISVRRNANGTVVDFGEVAVRDGGFSEEPWVQTFDAPSTSREDSQSSQEVQVRVGDQVRLRNKPEVGTGNVMFVGTTQFAPGQWVGLELSPEAANAGKNDGSVRGVRYFQASETRGLFVRPSVVDVVPTEPDAATTPRSQDAEARVKRVVTRRVVKSSPRTRVVRVVRRRAPT